VRRFYRSSYGWTCVSPILIVTAQLAYLRFKVDVTRSLPAQKVLAHPFSALVVVKNKKRSFYRALKL
jgi:hypothetical protein